MRLETIKNLRKMKKKFKPILFSTEMVQAILEGRKTQTRRVVKDKDKPQHKVGNILWVRETFAKAIKGFQYRANYSNNNQFMPKWEPSLFMPKDACRLFLEVTDIRVERLNDISESDAVKEGVAFRFNHKETDIFKNPQYYHYLDKTFRNMTSKSSFETLWQSINGKKEGATWNDNPFVWVVEFKVIDKPENFI